MNIRIEVRGLEELQRALDQKTLEPFLVRAGKAATTLVRNRLQDYPPARRSSRRTGRLRRGWKAQVSRTGRTARVVNRERYAHIVQGGTSTRSWYKDMGWVQASDLPRDGTVVGQVTRIYGEEIDNWVRDVG